MSVTKYDYALLEREYYTSDISIRKLCEKHGITNFSTVAVQAKKRGWEKMREEYKEKQREHDIESLARRRSQKLAQLNDDLIDIISATVFRMAENLKDPAYVVTPQDLVKIIQQVQLLSGGPTSREEVHAFNLSADLPADVLRDIQAAARAAGAGTRPVGQSALPQLEGPRKVN